jgi:hypothetical protein
MWCHHVDAFDPRTEEEIIEDMENDFH